MFVDANQPVQRKRGGGGLGKLLGTIVGGIGGFFVGGPAGAVAGAGLGGGLGETAGNLVKKPEEKQNPSVQKLGDPMQRRQEMADNQQKIAQLQDAAMATTELPPDQRGQYLDPIMKAASLLSPLRKGDQ
jgi:hypothetical protein